ncbi:MAG: InlB B-repeat-containing protein [Oscillospiraceae bacterium]|nr:InlB B-repeat-containing protein [Oscillospiraceae bacterium]
MEKFFKSGSLKLLLSKRVLPFIMSLLMIMSIAASLGSLTVRADNTTDVTLMSLTRTAVNAVSDAGNQFNADSGVYASVSNLTAWNNNTQKVIGYQGTNRTPIVFNNAAAGAWQSVGSAAIDAGVTVDTASAFQIKFATTDYENLKFTCTQKSTGSGPESFALAYSIGSPTGPYTAISNSKSSGFPKISDDTYGALKPSYTDFALPAAMENQSEVYLRVYMVDSALSNRSNGNTSINDIVITGTPAEIITPPTPLDVSYVTVAPGSDNTQLTFSWHTEAASINPAVRIWKDGSTTTAKFTGICSASVSSVSNMYYNGVTVTGLEADTAYTYQLGDGSGNWSREYTTKTENSNAFSYVVVGDPQIGSSGNVPSDTAGWVNTMNVIANTNPNAAFMMGTGDQIETTATLEQYDGFFSPSQMTSLPFASSMGNHEGNSAGPRTFYNPPNADSAQNYWYTYGDTLFIVWNCTAGTATDMDTFLKNATDANPGAKWRILTFHYDVYGQGSSHALSDGKTYRDTYVPVIDKYDIDVVFNGHDHSYSRSYPMIYTGDASTSNTVGMQPETFDPVTGASVNPTGTVYFSLDSSTGSKYYTLTTQQPYTASMAQNNLPMFSMVNMTADTFTCATYQINSDSSLTQIDTYTIAKVAEPVTHTVTFDGNGGLIRMKNGIPDAINGTPTATTATVTVNDGDKVGYVAVVDTNGTLGTFAGWYLGDVKFNFDGPITSQTSVNPITSDITLKAKWLIKPTASPASGALKPGDKITLSCTTLGATFEYLINTGLTYIPTTGEITIKESDFDANGKITLFVRSVLDNTRTSNVQLYYTKAEVVTHTVTFDGNGGLIRIDANGVPVTDGSPTATTAAVTVNDGDKVGYAPVIGALGYTFLGWYLDDGTKFEFDGKVPNFSINPITSDITLTAHWLGATTATPGNISFIKKGDTVILYNANPDAEIWYQVSSTMVYNEYVKYDGPITIDMFTVGNRTAPNYSNYVQIYVQTRVDGKTINNGLFNYYELDTVTFDSDGGSAVSPVDVHNYDKVAQPANPTKTGFTFDGWYLGDEKFDFSTPITDDVTLIAKWEEIIVTEPVVTSATPSAYVTKLNGNTNNLTITVTERYSDGSTKTITETFNINNNAAGTYAVGAYTVYVDTKGNDQIRDCYIVE